MSALNKTPNVTAATAPSAASAAAAAPVDEVPVNHSEDFKTRICKEAEALVKDFFPRKIAELDELLRRNDFNLLNISKVRVSTKNTLKNLTSNSTQSSGEGTVKSDVVFNTNDYNVKLIEMIKPEIVSLLEAINTLRVWVILLIPKIEDGNNFGVEVSLLSK